jgi:predicted DNA-binding protein (UPF0251 family)
MRPGRPRCPRRIENEPVISYFKPQGVPLRDLEVVNLSLEELEVVRLVDLEGLEQEGASKRMGISRRALWEDLQNARRKIVEALVKGKAIEIKGGNYTVERPRGFTCQECAAAWEIPFTTSEPSQCPKCGSNDVLRDTDHHDDNGPKRCCHGRCRQERE